MKPVCDRRHKLACGVAQPENVTGVCLPRQRRPTLDCASVANEVAGECVNHDLFSCVRSLTEVGPP